MFWPFSGGTNGATTRYTLLRKKKTTTGRVALIGGFQFHALRFR